MCELKMYLITIYLNTGVLLVMVPMPGISLSNISDYLVTLNNLQVIYITFRYMCPNSYFFLPVLLCLIYRFDCLHSLNPQIMCSLAL